MCRSFEPIYSIGNPLYSQVPFLYTFFKTHTFENLYLEIYCPSEIQDKQTKNSQEKIISLKQHSMSFIGNFFRFKIITISGIIRNLKKNRYNCIRPPPFKSQRYRVGYQSNKKLLYHQHPKKSTQFINSIFRYNRF